MHGGLLAIGLILLTMVAGCSDDSQARIRQEVDALTDNQPATTVAPAFQLPSSEQEIFDEMFAAAMADDVLSSEEVRLFALESVQCVERAGFEAVLHDFDPETGQASYSTAAAGPEEGPEQWVPDACFDGFYGLVFIAFTDQISDSK